MKKILVLAAAALFAFAPLSQARTYFQNKDDHHVRKHQTHRGKRVLVVRCRDGTLHAGPISCRSHGGVRDRSYRYRRHR